MHSEALIPKNWHLPGRLRKRLGNDVGRQRAIFEEGHLLIVLHRPPKAGELTREGRLFWFEPNGDIHSSHDGDRSDVLLRFLDRYGELVAEFDRIEEEAETAEQYFDLLRNISPVLRAARNVYAALEQARHFMPEKEQLVVARDQAYEIERISELVYNDGKLGLEYAMARQAEEQAIAARNMAKAAYRLNLLVAFFFPLATLGAIFGMNLKNGLESEPVYVFVGVIVFGLAAGLFLRRWLTRGLEKHKE